MHCQKKKENTYINSKLGISSDDSNKEVFDEENSDLWKLRQ